MKSRCLYNEGFPRLKKPKNQNNIDEFPNTMMYKCRTELTQRLLANTCEWCDSQEGQMEVHHIKKVKDLKGKKRWEQIMIARRRKTMVLCHLCHVKLHAGKLD